jgi:VIT1/CCC1 family predicted Fe2+/Mn2+ transporter
MPSTPHVESHFTAGDTVRDVVIGMADGLTVPFALAAGLSGAIASTSIVVTAGIAEIAAGSIAMGLGGYLAARSDSEHYQSELKREYIEIEKVPEAEKAEVMEVLTEFGLTPEQSVPIVEAMSKNPDAWVRFMMRFELGLEEPDPKRAPKSAATIAVSYIVGGLIPLSPYFMFQKAAMALPWSVGVTLAALFAFGAVKGRFTGVAPIKAALQTSIVGGLAAAAAFTIAKLVS